MSSPNSPRPQHPLSYYEEQVLEALKGLPTEFSVVPSSRLQFIEDGISYEPDFVIRRNDGQQIVIEVKSVQSLSMSNLSRLSQISKHIRKDGKGFVVLALDPAFGRPSTKNLEELNRLHIRNVATNSEIIQATLEEFDQLPLVTGDQGAK